MNINDLSKTELLHLIKNVNPTIEFNEDVQCACCGHPDVNWYYICDDCEERLMKD